MHRICNDLATVGVVSSGVVGIVVVTVERGSRCMLRVSPIRLCIFIRHISWRSYISLEVESVYCSYPHVLSKHAYSPFPEAKRTKVEASATPSLSSPSTANAIELERRQKLYSAGTSI